MCMWHSQWRNPEIAVSARKGGLQVIARTLP